MQPKPAERLKCYGHLHYRYITYSRQQQQEHGVNCIFVFFFFFLSPHADHITFLTGFTFLPRGTLSRCCINDSELYSSTAASLYWFCGLIIKNTPLWWRQNSCSSLRELGIQCSLTYAPLWVMRNLSPLITSPTFGRKQHFLLKVLFLFFYFSQW